jgi:transcription antitermination factor NusG
MFLQDFSDKTFILPNPENLQGGEKVRVIKGEFAGIEGELYRIKGHKRVVVKLEGLASLAMGNYIAKECLERI